MSEQHSDPLSPLETFVLNQKYQEILVNSLNLRSQLLNRMMLTDERRNIDKECGYPDSRLAVHVDEYQRLFERSAIAARVVEVFPRESWQVQPIVYEDESPEVTTEFEESITLLPRYLRGTRSWATNTKGNPIWEVCRRADELSGIGTYGIILIGIDDQTDMALPVQGMEDFETNLIPPNQPTSPHPASFANPDYVPSNPQDAYPYGIGGTAETYAYPYPHPQQQPQLQPGQTTAIVPQPRPRRRLLYLRAFPEALAQVATLETNPFSPRFGQPTSYLISFGDPRVNQGVIGTQIVSRTVHWHRVVHIADVHHTASSSETFAVQRMRPVLNHILDLYKLYGGSAEMYWLGAFPGYSFESNPQINPRDIRVDEDKLKDNFENYMNGLQRAMYLIGFQMKTHPPTVVDPRPQIEMCIEAIGVKLGMPIRIFKGSERGELASNQDDEAWNDRLRERQNGYITPRIIIPFIDRLIALGVLPEPIEFKVEWSDLSSQTDDQRADIALKKTQALAQYISSGSDAIISPLDYLVRFLHFTEEEAISILENTADYQASLPDEEEMNPDNEDQDNTDQDDEEDQDNTDTNSNTNTERNGVAAS